MMVRDTENIENLILKIIWNKTDDFAELLNLANLDILKNLSGADLSGTNLRGISFEGADLTETDLRNASLNFANLTNANLYLANLEEADLSYATLKNVNLIGVKLNNTNFSGVDLTTAKLDNTGRHYLSVNGFLKNRGEWTTQFPALRAFSNDFSDKDLINSVINGNEVAQKNFFMRFSRSIFHSIRNILWSSKIILSREEIEDLQQTVFLEIIEKNYKKLRLWRGEARLSTWLYIITRGVVLNYCRKFLKDDKKTEGRDIPFGSLENALIDYSMMIDFERKEAYELIENSFNTLSNKKQSVLIMYYCDEMSTSEVAKILGITKSGVYYLIHKALMELRSKIDQKKE